MKLVETLFFKIKDLVNEVEQVIVYFIYPYLFK